MAAREFPYRKLDHIEKLLIEIRNLLTPPPPVPPLPPCRPRTVEQIKELAGRGYTIEQITRELKIERETVRSVLERIITPLAPPSRIEIISESLTELSGLIARRLQQLPNRVELIEIDTTVTTQKSLQSEGKIKPSVALGFWVEDIGGGFTYVISRSGFGTDEKTAAVDDKWDIEFDDLLITGLGAGTARLWYWWREPVIVRE